MRLKHWMRTAMALMLCLSLAGLAAAAELTKIPTAWMDEQETFPMWYAKEKGWDKAAGLDIEMLYFNSGADALKVLPTGAWVFSGMNGIPAMLGALRYNTYVISAVNDEGLANAVMVRPDSPIMKVKGYNKSYPNIYGDPETVRGKTILCTTVSSAHVALSAWLKALGLSESDVTIKNMDQASAIAAFEYGIGDIVTLWSPLMYVGESRGWKIASTARDCYQGLPLVIVADRKYADAHPEITTRFLEIYLRAVEMIRSEAPEKLVPEYIRFYREWAGHDYSPELAIMDLKTHPVFTLEEQLKLFDSTGGMSQVQNWQAELAQFFASVGRINQEELKKVEDASYVTGKFLKDIKTPLPSYK